MYHGKHAHPRRIRLALMPAVGALALAPVLIHPGDTMSGIAAAHGLPLSAVEAANPQDPNPNLIYAGQYLNLPGGSGGNASSSLTPSFAPAAAAMPVSAPAASGPSSVSAAPGSYQQCVITRESGGNPHAVNASSGAGGLYQFTPETWAGLGYSGSPQDAPVAVQNQAFQRLYASNGKQPWSPSDGC